MSRRTWTLLLALLTLLLPSCGGAQRQQNTLKAKQIALAVHGYRGAKGTYPPAAICDTSGKPLLSWRVAILPYLEEAALYKKFHLDESWDSENNKKLLDSMPAVFATGGDAKGGKTQFVALVGEKGIFTGKPKGITDANISDGTSNTILLVEANRDRAVPWTQPEDIAFDPKQPLAGLGEAEGNAFLVIYVDGWVQFIRKNVPADTLRAMQTANGGESFQAPD